MSKLIKTMLISLISIVVISGITVVIVLNLPGKNDKTEAQTIDDIVEYSYETPDITTDLKDGSFVRIQFQITTDGKKAKEEISKRDFQIKNALIKEMAKMDEEDFKEGLDDLEDALKDRLNEVMTEGKITDVYTISKVLQ
ncbi:flagellar basal body-associated protein FliL [Virgibacillus sp. MSJ-26]|uniref:flagellar basal body-associated protein FliL n=1 Tax=Virgibacillus sp. MSJ-26 TaxID=2841522 RepID=UPI001C11B656|nr:flagellar basal body-associated protein FliL [Virgibacillus sp. MSJ-26]